MILLKDIVLEILKESEDVDWDLYEDLEQMYVQVFSEFSSKKYKRQPWTLVNFNRLKKIWEDFVKYHQVRDVRGLEDIEEIMKNNVLKLYVNTVLCGHTQEDPKQFFDDYSNIKYPSKKASDFFDFLDAPDGSYRISDYGMNPLMNLLFELRKAKEPEEKLLIIDKMLNVVHQRSDLASWFVEGGSPALSQLSGM